MTDEEKADEKKKTASQRKRSKFNMLVERVEHHLAGAHDALRELKALVDSGENPVQSTIKYWVDMWGRRYASNYILTKKDAGQIKRLVVNLGATESQARICRYFNDLEPFLTNEKHPLGLFMSRVSRYGATAAPSMDGGDDAPAAGCQHIPRCHSDQQHTQRKMREARA